MKYEINGHKVSRRKYMKWRHKVNICKRYNKWQKRKQSGNHFILVPKVVTPIVITFTNYKTLVI